MNLRDQVLQCSLILDYKTMVNGTVTDGGLWSPRTQRTLPETIQLHTQIKTQVNFTCHMKEVALWRARLVLGCVTVYGQVNHLGPKPAS